jgi:cell division protein FtsL
VTAPRTETGRTRLPLPRWATSVGVFALVTASLVFVAWAKMDTVQITYAIDDLVDEEENLAEEQRRLRAELANLRSPRNLEVLAATLELLPPEPGQVVVVGDESTALDPLLDAESARRGLGGGGEKLE